MSTETSFTRIPSVPPALFGRSHELEWLQRTLQHAPVVFLWGPAGFGKTALAVTAATSFLMPDGSHPAAPIVWASAEGMSTPAAFLNAVTVRTAHAVGLRLPASTGPRDEHAWTTRLLDVTEQGDCVVIVDDLHALPDGFVSAWMGMIATFGRRTRMIAVSRSRVSHERLAGRSLRVDRLVDAAVTSLVSQCDPTLDPGERARVVDLAAGSPLRAHRALLGERTSTEHDLLAGLSPAAQQTALALIATRCPVPLSTEIIAVLERRGLVRVTHNGAVLDPQVRSFVAHTEISPAAHAHALRLLEQADTPAAWVEIVRLAIESGDFQRASELLDVHREALCAQGYAETLFDLLGKARGDACWQHRIHVVVWLPGGEPLAWGVRQVVPGELSTRLVWARLCAHAGDIDRAHAVIEVLCNALDPLVAANAQLALADLERCADKPMRALEVLERMVPPTPRARIDRDLRRVSALIHAGEYERAETLLVAVRTAARDLSDADQQALRFPLISALLAAGDFPALEDFLGDLHPPAGCRAGETFGYIAAALVLGRFAELERLLLRAAPSVVDVPALAFMHHHAQVQMRLCRGEFAGLAAFACSGVERCVREGFLEHAVWAWGGQVAASLVTEPQIDLSRPQWSEPLHEGPLRWVMDAWWCISEARRGRTDATVASVRHVGPDVQVLLHRAAAERAIARKDFETAHEAIRAGLRLARQKSLRVDGLDLWALAVDLELLRSSGSLAPELVSACDALHREADSLGAVRHADEARFARALARGDRTGLADFTRSVSPIVVRRARAVLGEALPSNMLDALDTQVVQLHALDPRPTLSIDAHRRQVTTPNSTQIDLRATPVQFRLLEALARADRPLSKEHLAREVWGVLNYHPLRDDKRILVAIFRLRRQIEQAPDAPTLILHEDAGYRLAARVHFTQGSLK